MTDQPRDHLRIALAQLNPMMGDITGNLARVRAARAEAAKAGADIVLFPELFLCGYPPEDLVMKPALQDACREAVEAFAPETADGGPGVLLGTPWREDGKPYNAVAWIDGGKVAAITRQGRSAQLRRLRRKAHLRRRRHAGPAEHSRRAHRRAHLRGHLDAGHRRMPERDRRRNSSGAQRLALRCGKA